MEWALVILTPIVVAFACAAMLIYIGRKQDENARQRDAYNPTKVHLDALERIHNSQNGGRGS